MKIIYYEKDLRINSLSVTDILDEETEFLPLMSDEDAVKISKENAPDVLPILPLRTSFIS